MKLCLQQMTLMREAASPHSSHSSPRNRSVAACFWGKLISTAPFTSRASTRRTFGYHSICNYMQAEVQAVVFLSLTCFHTERTNHSLRFWERMLGSVELWVEHGGATLNCHSHVLQIRYICMLSFALVDISE